MFSHRSSRRPIGKRERELNCYRRHPPRVEGSELPTRARVSHHLSAFTTTQWSVPSYPPGVSPRSLHTHSLSGFFVGRGLSSRLVRRMPEFYFDVPIENNRRLRRRDSTQSTLRWLQWEIGEREFRPQVGFEQVTLCGLLAPRNETMRRSHTDGREASKARRRDGLEIKTFFLGLFLEIFGQRGKEWMVVKLGFWNEYTYVNGFLSRKTRAENSLSSRSLRLKLAYGVAWISSYIFFCMWKRYISTSV